MIGSNEFLNPSTTETRCIFSIRQAATSDIPELRELYKNTVLTVNCKDYSPEEVEDWASCGNDPLRWQYLIDNMHFIVATNKQLQLVGFSAVTPQGYLHSLFVHYAHQHMGIATMLLNETEQYAKKNGILTVTSEVSITARPFFEKQGFTVIEEQKRRAKKLLLTNYRMSKHLCQNEK